MTVGAANSGPRLWFLVLFAAWAVLLLGGFVFGTLNADETRRMPTWTRMASSLVLVLAGWSYFALERSGPAGLFSLLVAAGMSLGCLGDFFMAGLIAGEREAATLGGMASFGLGHVAYIAACVLFSNAVGLHASAARWGSWVAWILIGVVGWYLVVFRDAATPTVLDWAALPYALLLASTAGFATSLAVQDRQFVGLAAGAALFLLSDLILAGQLFRKAHFTLINDVVWLTYGPGQMLIVFACSAAQGLARAEAPALAAASS